MHPVARKTRNIRSTQTFVLLYRREADAYLENDTKRAGVEVSDTHENVSVD